MYLKKLLLTSLAFWIILDAGENVFAQRTRPVRKPSSVLAAPRTDSPELKRRLAAFEKAWQVINDYYYDKTFNNLNWANIKTEYEPRVRAAPNDRQFHNLLHEMINKLGKSHLAIIPPEVYQEIANAKLEAKTRKGLRKNISIGSAEDDEEENEPDFDAPLANYGIGVDLRVMNGQFVITRVNKNAAAEYAGLRPGFVIEKVNEVNLADIVSRISLYYGSSHAVMRLISGEIVSGFLNGEKDSTLDITYLDEKDERKQVTVRRELMKSQTISIGMNFPEQQLEYETSSLSDDVGYIRFNQFALPVIEKFCGSLTELKGKSALIIDLRGNTGGIIASLVGLGGMLSETPVNFGTSIYKGWEETLTAASKAKKFRGKLVILVDGTTASAAEMFAISLQESGRALIVGERTAGASLPSMVIDLPTGAVMQYPIANYRSGKGSFLEDVGVTPNYPVSLDRISLASGHDLQLDKALSLIKDNTAFPPQKAEPLGGSAFGSGPPPPPPPPAKAPPRALSNKVLAEVTIKAPAVKEAVKVREPAAVK